MLKKMLKIIIFILIFIIFICGTINFEKLFKKDNLLISKEETFIKEKEPKENIINIEVAEQENIVTEEINDVIEKVEEISEIKKETTDTKQEIIKNTEIKNENINNKQTSKTESQQASVEIKSETIKQDKVVIENNQKQEQIKEENQQTQESTPTSSNNTNNQTTNDAGNNAEDKEKKNIESFKVNNSMIEKIRNIINSNPSTTMQQFGYNIVVDSSIVSLTTGFTFTETRVKNAVKFSAGTIKIYARDYYVDDELRWTECFIL